MMKACRDQAFQNQNALVAHPYYNMTLEPVMQARMN